MSSPIRQDESFLGRVLEAAPFGIWVADAEGRIVYANERIAELLGTSVAAMIGYPLQPFVPGEMPMPDGADKGGAPAQQERRLVRADGYGFDAMLAITPLENAGDGEPG